MAKTINWKRIESIHDRIKSEYTGPPFDLAKSLGISKSLLFQCMEDMRIMGFPIAYCRKKRSYYYSDTCDFITDRVATLRTSNGIKNLV